jgi:two-component system C4-dicarboxylate transport response regulator DctD
MTRTILIVEDDDVCRDALEVALGNLPGFAVRTVATAEQALECLAAEDVCALVTDLRLGQMDGFELIGLIRSQPRRASLPILVISGDSDPDSPIRSVRMGANAYFSKPYSPAAICSKLEQLVHAE